jgi:hypothetical protein
LVTQSAGLMLEEMVPALHLSTHGKSWEVRMAQAKNLVVGFDS